MEELTTFTENYLRLHLLEVKGGTPVLRCLFLKIVKNSSSKGDVDKYLAFFVDDIKLAKPPTSAEYRILFPSNGTTDINKWDISLLAYILIHCCTLDGQLSLKGKKTPKEILKKEVNSTIYNGDFDLFLQCESNKNKIDKMKGKNIITDKQYDSLYPLNNQKTDINAWDIELLILVLFNLGHDDNLQKIRGICEDVVTREVKLCCDTSIDLNVFLRKHEHTFNVMRNDGKLADSQHQQLFPSHGVSDLGNWDDTVLSLVVLNACQTLSPPTLDAVKKIRTLRKELAAHPESTEVDNDTFRATWSDLLLAIHTIILTDVPEIKTEIDIATDAFKYGRLDIKSAIATLKEHDAKYISILSKLTAMELSFASINRKLGFGIALIGNIGRYIVTKLTSGLASTDRNIRQSEIDMIQTMDTHHDTEVQLLQEIKEQITELNLKLPEPAYSERREIKCFTLIFSVRGGKSKEAVDEVENTIKKSMDGVDDNDTEKVTEVIELIKETLSKNDIQIEGTRLGSIIVVVKCLSVRGLHNLVNIVGSTILTDHLNTLSTIFSERTGCPILIDASIPRSSLQTICKEIRKLNFSCESNEHQGFVEMQLKATSVKGMVNIWQTLQDKRITTSLQTLSEKLSDELKEKVEISIKFQPEEFLSALKSAGFQQTQSWSPESLSSHLSRENGSVVTDCRETITKHEVRCNTTYPPLMSGNTSENTIMDVNLPTTTPVTTPHTALGLPMMSGNTSEKAIMDVDLPTTTPFTIPHKDSVEALGLPMMSGNTSEKAIMDVDLPTTTPFTIPHKDSVEALGLPMMSGNTSEKAIMDVDLPTTTPFTIPHKDSVEALGPPLMSGDTGAKRKMDFNLPRTRPVTTLFKVLGTPSAGDQGNSQQQARAHTVAYAREIRVKIKKETNVCDICGLCMLQDGSMLLINGNTLKRLDSSFRVIDWISVRDIFNVVAWDDLPRYVCCISATEVAVSLLFCINFVSVSGKLACTRSIELEHVCCGLAYGSGELYSYDGRHSIHVYSIDGRRLPTIDTCAEYNLSHYFSSYYNSIAVSDDGYQLYVSIRDGIMCLNKQGKILWKFTDDYQEYVCTVCVGNDNTVFVSSHDTMQQISPNGQTISVIQGTDRLERINSMCYDRLLSRLIVTRYGDDHISVYDLTTR